MTLWLAGELLFLAFFLATKLRLAVCAAEFMPVLCVRLSCRSVRLDALHRMCARVSCVSCCAVMSCEVDVDVVYVVVGFVKRCLGMYLPT